MYNRDQMLEMFVAGLTHAREGDPRMLDEVFFRGALEIIDRAAAQGVETDAIDAREIGRQLRAQHRVQPTPLSLSSAETLGDNSRRG